MEFDEENVAWIEHIGCLANRSSRARATKDGDGAYMGIRTDSRDANSSSVAAKLAHDRRPVISPRAIRRLSTANHTTLVL
jgi:hypothetical protein